MVHRKVLVVCHGSRSRRWVAAQREWFDHVRERLVARAIPMQPILSFLEITDPLFEDVLASLAAERDPAAFPGGRLAILPFFLARSGHAGEEIPAIASKLLHPRGLDWQYAGTGGWERVLGANAEARLEAMGCEPGEQVIVSGYGASGHDGQWRELVADIHENAGRFAGGKPWLWAPAGHFLPNATKPLYDALESVRRSGEGTVAILPLYLAVSSYQETLIPSVMRLFPSLRIRFEPTAVLPSGAVEEWAVERLADCLIGEVQR